MQFTKVQAPIQTMHVGKLYELLVLMVASEGAHYQPGVNWSTISSTWLSLTLQKTPLQVHAMLVRMHHLRLILPSLDQHRIEHLCSPIHAQMLWHNDGVLLSAALSAVHVPRVVLPSAVERELTELPVGVHARRAARLLKMWHPELRLSLQKVRHGLHALTVPAAQWPPRGGSCMHGSAPFRQRPDLPANATGLWITINKLRTYGGGAVRALLGCDLDPSNRVRGRQLNACSSLYDGNYSFRQPWISDVLGPLREQKQRQAHLFRINSSWGGREQNKRQARPLSINSNSEDWLFFAHHKSGTTVGEELARALCKIVGRPIQVPHVPGVATKDEQGETIVLVLH